MSVASWHLSGETTNDNDNKAQAGWRWWGMTCDMQWEQSHLWKAHPAACPNHYNLPVHAE